MQNKDSETSPKTPGRFNWELERQKLAATSPDAPDEGKVLDWGQPAPQESPVNRRQPIPSHLRKIVGFFKGIISDEGLLLDLVLDHVMDLVKRNVEQRTFGTDGFQGDMGQISPAQYASLAGPLAVELYKEVTKAIEKRADEYVKLHQDARLELERSAPSPSRIVLPP